MLRAIIAALVTGAVVTGLSSTVYAQSITRSQSANGFTTLSGESLRRIENRNFSKDFSLLSETSPTSQLETISLPNENSAPTIKIPSLSVFGKKVEIDSGNSLSGSKTPVSTQLVWSNKLEVSTGGSPVDSERLVRVQYQLRDYLKP